MMQKGLSGNNSSSTGTAQPKQSVYSVWCNNKDAVKVPDMQQQPMTMFRVAQVAQKAYTAVSAK